MTKTITVTQNLELLGKYRYVEIQMMELMGSWAYTIVEPEIKIGFGRQMYQDAVHADMLGKRLPELKGRSEHFHYIAPSDAFVRLLEKIWQAQDSLRRMVALYRVLKPALVAAYEHHLEHAELPADEPTAYILRNILDEERDHSEWGENIINTLIGSPDLSPEISEKRSADILSAREAGWKPALRFSEALPSELAAQWQQELENDLAEAGGIRGEGKAPGTISFKKTHPHSKRPARDSRWKIIENDSEFTEKNWSFDNDDGKCHLLHDLLNSEFITVERMGRIIADFPEIPWQMKMDMAHQAWDEARHAEIVQRRLEELGGHVGMFRTSCFGWEQDVNRPDPLERLALSNMTFESESCKHLRDWIGKAKKVGDTRSVQLLEFLLADEVNHVLYGTHWVDELTKNDPERRKRVLAYPEKVLIEHHPVGVKFEETTYERA